MNKIFFLLFVPLLFSAQTTSHKIRVLFLGNSYTFYNNMPLMVSNIATAQGDTLVYDSYSPGGYTFNNHAADANTLAKISAGNWDFVVLQAQSQEPSFPPAQVNAQTLPYAIKLDSLIKHYNPCAHTVFYETWGRKFGDATNCPFYPPLCTYAGMQDRLLSSYKLFADTVKGLMAPVGEAFRLTINTNTTLNLYDPDQSHPSLLGSYLAAAVFYETLFQKTVLTSTYNPGVTTTTVSFLNQAAHQLVSDSAHLTNIPLYLPQASFTSITPDDVNFQFVSGTPAFTHLWYFGDGNTSSLVSPAHTYTSGGTYTVSLVIKNTQGCVLDSVSSVVNATVLTTGFTDLKAKKIQVYPNPCDDYLTLKLQAPDTTQVRVEIRSLVGQLVYSGAYQERIETSFLPQGVYYLRVFAPDALYNSCFVKNE